MSTRRLLLPLYLLTLSGTLVSSELVLEAGYYVSTVLDFNKPLPSGGINGHGVHPFALHPLNRSPNLLLLLDFTNSSFYSLELPVSQESRLRLLSGKRTAGFDDGDAISAMFNRPRSFTVDNNDNVYVADRINHAIRKINGFSGLTTTIAGGYSKKAGHTDGPAQNATFSEDFDIIFMRKMCSLLISDRGSRMIRQMNLKPEDCEEKPISSQGLGAIPVSAIAVLALLCGLALGFMARPFVISSSSTGSLHEPLHPPLMESYPNNSEETSTDVLLRHQKHFVSRNHTSKLQQFTDEMKDLMYFEEENSVLDLSSSANQVETEEASGRNLHEAEDESNLNGKIDNMLVTNLLDFTASSKEQSLVKRRRNGVHDLSI